MGLIRAVAKHGRLKLVGTAQRSAITISSELVESYCPRSRRPRLALMSSYGNDLGNTEAGVGGENDAADLHLGHLAGKIMCREPLTQSLEARDGGLGQVAAVVTAPPFPEPSAMVADGTKGFVAFPCSYSWDLRYCGVALWWHEQGRGASG